MAPDRGCYNFIAEYHSEEDSTEEGEEGEEEGEGEGEGEGEEEEEGESDGGHPGADGLSARASTSKLAQHDDEHTDATAPLQQRRRRRSSARRFLARHAEEGQNFTLRGVLLGLAVGLLICFSNTFFGLQTGWIGGMSMPASLLGFAFFKAFSAHLDFPFTPVENVLVQTVAGAVGTMPLGSGFVGVIPAIEFLLKPAENGPLQLPLWKLMIWALGLCFFGVVFGVPLRKEVIIREKLKFPSGTATALMIGVLHENRNDSGKAKHEGRGEQGRFVEEERSRLLGDGPEETNRSERSSRSFSVARRRRNSSVNIKGRTSWRWKITLLLLAFAASSVYALITYFVPVLRNLPVFGLPLATKWLWTLNPSPAYVGQGVIMGPATTLHMMLGAIVGWGILSPLAKHKGWAPGPVKDWTHGSKGWIVWISLAIMLSDSLVSLGYLAFRTVSVHGPSLVGILRENIAKNGWKDAISFGRLRQQYTPLDGATDSSALPSGHERHGLQITTSNQATSNKEASDAADVDAPPEHLVGNGTVLLGLVASLLFCVVSIHVTFGSLVPLYATVTAVLMALLLSIMGVRALGETDLNPVSGISKLTQLFFALVVPRGNRNAVLINLIAGAVSESGALQAGDMMQDLKTGHLLGASPKAQFYGQMIGSGVGAVASACVYKLYTSVYSVPGDLFQVPTGFVWIFTARLVTGEGLPPHAWEWALGAAVLFALTTAARTALAGSRRQSWIPGGIAVAVGMYNVPSFTIARAIGGLMSGYWCSYRGADETPLIILASGMILGEGVASIVNLGLASLGVPHL